MLDKPLSVFDRPEQSRADPLCIINSSIPSSEEKCHPGSDAGGRSPEIATWIMYYGWTPSSFILPIDKRDPPIAPILPPAHSHASLHFGFLLKHL